MLVTMTMRPLNHTVASSHVKRILLSLLHKVAEGVRHTDVAERVDLPEALVHSGRLPLVPCSVIADSGVVDDAP